MPSAPLPIMSSTCKPKAGVGRASTFQMTPPIDERTKGFFRIETKTSLVSGRLAGGVDRHHHHAHDIEQRRHGGGGDSAKSQRPVAEIQGDNGESDEGVPARGALKKAGELRPIDGKCGAEWTAEGEQKDKHGRNRQHHGEGHAEDRKLREIGGGDFLENDGRKEHEIADAVHRIPMDGIDEPERRRP